MKVLSLVSQLLIFVAAFGAGWWITEIVHRRELASPERDGMSRDSQEREQTERKRLLNVEALGTAKQFVKLVQSGRIREAIREGESREGQAKRTAAAIAIGNALALLSPSEIDLIFDASEDAGFLATILAVVVTERCGNLSLAELFRVTAELEGNSADEFRHRVFYETRQQLVAAAAESNPVKAWAFVDDETGENGFRDTVLRQALRSDPRLALNLASGGRPESLAPDDFKTLAGRLGEWDLNARVAFFGSAMRFDSGREAESHLLEALILNNHHDCLGEFCRTISLGEITTQSAAKVLEAVINSDSSVAAKWIANATEDQVVEVLKQTDAEKVLRSPAFAFSIWEKGIDIGKISPGHCESLFQAIGSRMGAVGVERVLDQLDLPHEHRIAVVAGAAQALAHREPEEALKMLDSIPNGSPGVFAAVEGIARELARSHFDAALAEVERIEPKRKLPFLKGLTDAGFRKPVDVANAMQDWLSSDAPSLESIEVASDAADSISRQLWMEDPEFVGSWLRELPEGPIQDSAADGLMQSLGTLSPMQLSRWLSSWPKGHLLDRFAQQLALNLPGDPGGALAWAASIEDLETRRSVMQKVIDEATVFRISTLTFALLGSRMGTTSQDRIWAHSIIEARNENR